MLEFPCILAQKKKEKTILPQKNKKFMCYWRN